VAWDQGGKSGIVTCGRFGDRSLNLGEDEIDIGMETYLAKGPEFGLKGDGSMVFETKMRRYTQLGSELLMKNGSGRDQLDGMKEEGTKTTMRIKERAVNSKHICIRLQSRRLDEKH